MVEQQPARLDAVFGALADATRRQILAQLASGPASTMALAAPFDMICDARSIHASQDLHRFFPLK